MFSISLWALFWYHKFKLVFQTVTWWKSMVNRFIPLEILQYIMLKCSYSQCVILKCITHNENRNCLLAYSKDILVLNLWFFIHPLFLCLEFLHCQFRPVWRLSIQWNLGTGWHWPEGAWTRGRRDLAVWSLPSHAEVCQRITWQVTFQWQNILSLNSNKE